MSTTGSIANFYVDKNGQEQPIRYKAADLVNKLAPIGYHWERRNGAEIHNEWLQTEEAKNYQWCSYLWPQSVDRNNDYYICVKDTQ